MSASDRHVGGDHYNKLAVEVWDALQSWMTPEEFQGFLKGCAIKYLARTKENDDIYKAHHVLEKLIEEKEKEQSKVRGASGNL